MEEERGEGKESKDVKTHDRGGERRRLKLSKALMLEKGYSIFYGITFSHIQ